MAEGTDKPVRGQDMAAPVQAVTLSGVRYPLKWCNRTARLAEDVYEDVYGRDADYMQILRDLTQHKYRALQACVYAAMIAGGAEMTFEDFDAAFSYDSIDGVREQVQNAVLRMLPDAKAGN